MKKEMCYKKCIDCQHAEIRYDRGGGLYIFCLVSGDFLEVRECPVKCEHKKSLVGDYPNAKGMCRR